MPAIYPDTELGEKKGAEKMKDQAYEYCKAKYEEVYGIPLVYGDETDKTNETEAAQESQAVETPTVTEGGNA